MSKNISTWKRRSLIAQRILSKNFFRLFGNVNQSLQTKENFNIKKGYHHAASILDFDDTSNTDEWQKEVYLLAKEIVEQKKYQSVIDVGCGSAYKLVNYLGSYKTLGIEVGETLKWLKKNYPEHQWLSFEEADPSLLQFDVVICSDVIEHIDNPDTLLEFIKKIDCKEIILSTPEREAVAGKNDYGPPENPAHYREWNAEEFKNYISKYFVIEEQRIFNDKSVTQVIICKK
ncbi:MAG TPA: methyltransferase domain-containing protein [Puia sp.]|nr:methyltransferase domain-containing protein [Puia sp.]